MDADGGWTGRERVTQRALSEPPIASTRDAIEIDVLRRSLATA